MEDDRDAGWSAITADFGEALLDVERTFLKALDRQARLADAAPLDLREDPVAAHLAAWARLDNAHRELVPYLSAFSTLVVDRMQETAAAGLKASCGGLQAVRTGGR